MGNLNKTVPFLSLPRACPELVEGKDRVWGEIK